MDISTFPRVTGRHSCRRCLGLELAGDDVWLEWDQAGCPEGCKDTFGDTLPRKLKEDEKLLVGNVLGVLETMFPDEGLVPVR